MNVNEPTCLFCKIAGHEIPAKVQYEDNETIAFDDIHPKAPIHILVVPKRHIPTIDDLTDTDQSLIGQLILRAQRVAREKNLAENGYRLVFNVRGHAGQTVDHIHLHILGGQPLKGMA